MSLDETELIPRVRDEWTSLVWNNHPTDLDELKGGLARLYALAGFEAPRVRLVGGPAAARSMRKGMRREIHPACTADVSGRLRDCLWARVGHPSWDQIGGRLGGEVVRRIDEQIRRDGAWSSPRDALREVLDHCPESGGPGMAKDAPWTAVCDYFRKIGVLQLPEFDAWVGLLRSGLWAGIFLAG